MVPSLMLICIMRLPDPGRLISSIMLLNSSDADYCVNFISYVIRCRGDDVYEGLVERTTWRRCQLLCVVL